MQHIIFFKVLPVVVLVWTTLRAGIVMGRHVAAHNPLPFALPKSAMNERSILERHIGGILVSQTGLAYRALLFFSGLGLHLCLFLSLARHLRLLLNPVPHWLTFFETPGLWAGFSLPFFILLRILMRFLNARLFRLSTNRDYFFLYSLLFASLSGLFLHFVFPTDLVCLKQNLWNMFRWRMESAPWPGGALSLHLLGVVTVLLLPADKLMHGVWFFFNPHGRLASTDLERENPWRSEMAGVTAGSQALGKGESPWDLHHYRQYLQARWSEKGVREVLSARERSGVNAPGGYFDKATIETRREEK